MRRQFRDWRMRKAANDLTIDLKRFGI